ncbi:MAG: archaellin/type IV pilin N-terminal domain-containing protein [Candidatus Bathyarchaeia archaeon]|jgi:flagellin-like protein
MNYRKFKKNAKALSPVIASIILIAVTVAVSVVVAAWMGGLTLGFMGNAEQGSITNAVFTSNTSVTLTVQNTGSNTITIQSATIDSNTATLTPITTATILKGASGSFNVTAIGGTFAAGAQYTFNLLTAKGHTLTYSATYNTNPAL